MVDNSLCVMVLRKDGSELQEDDVLASLSANLNVVEWLGNLNGNISQASFDQVQ